MNRQVMRVVAGANLVAGCLLLQGCGMFGGKKADAAATTVPGSDLPPVEVQPVEAVATTPVVETAPVELPSVQSTTPYTIMKGDTISAISYKYNLRWQDVLAVNPGISPTRLRVGQVIQLPGQVDLSKARYVPSTKAKASAPKTSAPKVSAPKATAKGPMTTYVVKSGDSLSVIAHKHGVKTAALREANGLKSDRIVVGQKLKVPGATKTPAATAKKAAPAAAPKTVAPKTAAAKPAEKPAEPAPAPAAVTPPPEPAPAAEAAAPAPEPVPAAEAAPAPAAESNTQTYTVKEGEDLYAVAIRWGVSPSDLKSLNNLTSTELKAGTILKIPGVAQ